MLTTANSRRYTLADRLIATLDDGLKTLAPGAETPETRPAPCEDLERGELSPTEVEKVGGLMRINHSGEVCAQALYKGQAATAKTPQLARHLHEAAQEELDHLSWCQQMLTEIGAKTSLLNPLWYGGSYALGALAGVAGDRWSLAFLVETERQVEAHLDDHLAQLPATDARSRAILSQMKVEEAAHAERAEAAGAAQLPAGLKRLMGAAAALMKALTYRF